MFCELFFPLIAVKSSENKEKNLLSDIWLPQNIKFTVLTLPDNHQLVPLFPVLITPLHNELD